MKISCIACCLSCFCLFSVAEQPSKNQIIDWSFNGVSGKFDRASIQRGFLVYKEVCSSCHSIKNISFRNLKEIGFNDEEVKAIASNYTIKDGPNEEGDFFDRNGVISDYFPPPYLNDNAAKYANNGALPIDLSVIIKARKDGANYMYSLLTGYSEDQENLKLEPGTYYNKYFYDNKIAMPPPFVEDQVLYLDGTKATVKQMAKDVTHFLHWCSEPEMEKRKALGIKVMLFLLIAAIICYFANKRIWKKAK